MSNDTQPEIRFPGFTEDWEQRKLIDLVVRLNKSTNSSRLPKVEFEDIVAGEGRLNKDVSQKFDNRKGIEFLPNDILYGKLRPYLKNWLKATFTGVAIGDFWVFRAKKSDSDFVYSLIQADRYQKAANDTSGTKMPRSDWKKVSDTVFYIPNDLKEQQKIGIFFKKLDDTITLHQRKLDLLKETKKGFLQKMFPKNGAKVPEIRFPGFTEDWEARKLIDYLDVSTQKNKDEIYDKGDVLSVSGDCGIVNQIEFQGRSFAGVSVANYGVVETGDIVYTKSPLKANPYGIIKTNKGKTGIVSTLYAVYKPKQITDPEFVQIYFEQDVRMNNYMRPLVNKGAKNDMKVSDENALKGEVMFPKLEEQRKISSYFEQLNNLITLHQRELDLLKETKKGFLQKMFV
ncbi:restriction endonuclease subunit S [Enterococcus faecium]|uniref:restriction endonuclease subunit S n=1 Tax=Enterococcus faecium TaxID=1352 RepID=UPI002FBE0781